MSFFNYFHSFLLYLTKFFYIPSHVLKQGRVGSSQITSPLTLCRPGQAMKNLARPWPSGQPGLALPVDSVDPIHLHTDEEGCDKAAWIAKSRQQANEVFPKWLKEVRETYGRYCHQYRKFSI